MDYIIQKLIMHSEKAYKLYNPEGKNYENTLNFYTKDYFQNYKLSRGVARTMRV